MLFQMLTTTQTRSNKISAAHPLLYKCVRHLNILLLFFLPWFFIPGQKKPRKWSAGKLSACQASWVCGIYTCSNLKNTIFSLPLLAEHFMRKMNWKKPKHLLCCPIFLFDFKQGFSYFAVLLCQGRRDEAFVVRSRETLSELQSVEIDRV